MYRNLFFITVFTFLILNTVKSQEITAKLTNDTNNVLIGEHITLNINVKFKNVNNIVFPVFADTLEKLDIVELFPVDTFRINNKIESLSKKFIVTAFDSGYYEIPPLIISYQRPNEDDIKITQTNSLVLNFNTIHVDTSGTSLKDIKPPIEIPFDLEDLLPYLVIVLIILLLYYILVYIFGKKRKKNEKVIPKYDPRIPADLEAIEHLQRLEKENLWQKGEFKKYYTKLTDILRVYIHRRYHLNSLEMTSVELIDELNRYEQNFNAMNMIQYILNIADLAKFAKYEPINDENIESIKYSYSFINLTKVVDISEEDIKKSNIDGGEL